MEVKRRPEPRAPDAVFMCSALFDLSNDVVPGPALSGRHRLLDWSPWLGAAG